MEFDAFDRKILEMPIPQLIEYVGTGECISSVLPGTFTAERFSICAALIKKLLVAKSSKEVEILLRENPSGNYSYKETKAIAFYVIKTRKMILMLRHFCEEGGENEKEK